MPGPVPKPIGRPLGSKNKRKTVADIFEELAFDPIRELVERLDTFNPTTQAKVLVEMTAFIAPKLSAQTVDLSAEVTTPKHVLEREVLNRLLANPEAVKAIKVLEANMPVEPKTEPVDAYAPDVNWAEFPKPE